MSAEFVPGFVRWLDKRVPQPVRLAQIGAPLTAGSVLVAPADHHLVVARDGCAGFSDAPPERGFRPAIDVLFRTAADVFGAATLACVLTGMGDDGTAGAAAVRAAGGRVLAQDERSSPVFGMPRAARDAGAVDEMLGLDAMARRINQLARFA